MSTDTPTYDARTSHVVPPARLWELQTWLLTHLAGRSYRLVLDELGSAAARTNYSILIALEEFGPISQADLGRSVFINRGDLVAILNALETDGLVVRAPDENDPRRNAITITKTGSRTLRKLDKQLEKTQELLLEPLSAAERDQFTELLHRLVEHHTPVAAPASATRSRS